MSLPRSQRVINLLHFRAPLTTLQIAAALKEDPEKTQKLIKSLSYKGKIKATGKVEGSKLKLWELSEKKPKSSFNPHSLPFNLIGDYVGRFQRIAE